MRPQQIHQFYLFPSEVLIPPEMLESLSKLRLSFDILSFFALNSCSPVRSLRTRIIWKTWSVIVLMLQCFLLPITLAYSEKFLHSDLSPVGMMLNMVHYSWMIICNCITITLSLVTEKDQIRFWTQLQRLRVLRFQEEPLDTDFFGKLAKKALLIILPQIFLNVLVMFLVKYDPLWVNHHLVRISSILINRMFCVKVYLFFRGLYCEVEAFERHLQVLVDRKELREAHITMVFDWHSSLIDTSRIYRKMFNWSLLALFLDSFIEQGTDFYWAYVQMHCAKNFYATASK